MAIAITTRATTKKSRKPMFTMTSSILVLFRPLGRFRFYARNRHMSTENAFETKNVWTQETRVLAVGAALRQSKYNRWDLRSLLTSDPAPDLPSWAASWV